jgi:hypothetical protein
MWNYNPLARRGLVYTLVCWAGTLRFSLYASVLGWHAAV